MGNIADEMEDILGIKKENDAEETISPEKTEEKQQSSTPTIIKTTSLTDEQINIQKDITKIDIQIEELEKQTVDVEDFYNNIDTHLSEDEQALEFENKPKYMKIVNEKLLEFQKQKSNTKELESLKEQKEELNRVYERQGAIAQVSAKHPQFDYEKVHEFFTTELSKKEQDKIYEDASSYADVYELAFKKMIEQNPKNIQQERAPNIPDVSKVSKTQPKHKDTDDGLLDEDAQLAAALGL